MPRFHWHVENGLGAFIPPGGLTPPDAAADGGKSDGGGSSGGGSSSGGVTHAMCEIEVPGRTATLRACFTLPANYLSEGATKPCGVLLGHGGAPPFDWQGPLMAGLATALAKAGFIVVRDVGPVADEVQRQRAFEKVLDAAATSPFARLVPRWVVGGAGAGARVAAVAGARARSSVAGEVLLAYPLAAPMPTIKGSQMPDSCMPLLRVSPPALLLAGDADPACPVVALRSAVRAMASGDVRLVVAQGVDGRLCAPGGGPEVSGDLISAVTTAVLEFVSAVAAGKMEACGLQRAKGPEDGPPEGPALQALQAAQMRMQEEDALAYHQDPSTLLPSDAELAAAAGGATAAAAGAAGGSGGAAAAAGAEAAAGEVAGAQEADGEGLEARGAGEAEPMDP